MQGQGNLMVSHVLGQCQKIQIISGGITLQDENALDAKDFSFGRYCDRGTVVIHYRCFQRYLPNQLTHSGFNTIETAKNLDRTLYTCSFPAGNGLELKQNFVKMLAQVGQYAVGIL